MNTITLLKEDVNTMAENLDFCASKLRAKHVQNGRTWYKETNRQAKNMYQFYNVLDVDKIAQLIAIHSSNMPWNRNLIEVHHTLNMIRKGIKEDIVNNRIYQSKASYKKALILLDGNNAFTKRTKAKKTHSFYTNIMLEKDFCTIDTHHLKAMVSNTNHWKKILSNKGIYEDMETITKDVCTKYSNKFGLNLYQFQASIWVLIREEYNTFKDSIKSVSIKPYSNAKI